MVRGSVTFVCLLASCLAAAGCDSRSKAMEQELAGNKKVGEDRVEVEQAGPSHPIRDELAPVLSKIYPLQALPRVVEADIDIEGPYNYELEPGVAAVVRFRSGLSKAEQVKVFGFDGAADAVRLISEGKIAATVMQFPKLMAQKAAEMADDYLKGQRDFDQKVPIAVELVNQENIEKFVAYGKKE